MLQLCDLCDKEEHSTLWHIEAHSLAAGMSFTVTNLQISQTTAAAGPLLSEQPLPVFTCQTSASSLLCPILLGEGAGTKCVPENHSCFIFLMQF